MYKKEEFSAPEILLFFILENIHYIQELKNRDYFY